MKEKSFVKRLTDRCFGSLPMTWPAVLLFAAGAALVTALFLIVPAFQNSSFERMGVTFEAWIFFAVLIMANCRKPLESALKTFVFFLVSQPLIYLIQVPFSAQGWGLFGYYRYWFLLTLLTFPAAWIGWYIKKKSWLSLLILSPVLGLLTYDYVTCFQSAARHFPRLLVTAVFCLAQVLLYLAAFTENRRQKWIGFLVPLAAVLILLSVRPQLALNSTLFLPDEPVLTEEAAITVEDSAFASVTVERTGADSMVRVQGSRYGETAFTVQDGANTYRYRLRVYEDDTGHPQISIEPST